MAEMKNLIKDRANTKRQMTRMHNVVAAGGLNAVEAKIRLSKTEGFWSDFENVQRKIEQLRTGKDDEEQKQIEIEEEDTREEFEGTYFTTASILQGVIDKEERAQAAAQAAAQPQVAVTAGEGRPEQVVQQQRRVDVKLPVLTIPEFNGDYDKWMLFKDSFESLIHQNVSLTEIQKFQYLRSALKGDAVDIIAGLNTTTENYQIAWNLLKKNYDNKKLIINTHLNRLLDFPMISRDKTDKPFSMKQFIVHIRKHVKALEVLKQPVEHWDTILIHLAKSKLDFMTQCEWEKEIGQSTEEMPKVEDLLKFLEEKCSTLELVDSNKVKLDHVKNVGTRRNDHRVAMAATTQEGCAICKQRHGIYRCPDFIKLSTHDKGELVREKRLCLNCLNPGHYSRDCKAGGCKNCDRMHNTLLHWERSSSSDFRNGRNESAEPSESATTHHAGQAQQNEASMEQNSNQGPDQNGNAVSNHCSRQSTSHIILSTAQVYVEDKNGSQHRCRLLLDPGSQVHFATEDLIKRLGLQIKKGNRAIDGINNTKTNVAKSAQITIQSIHNNYKTSLDCLVTPKITKRLPQVTINRMTMNIPNHVRLADPEFDKPGEIDILISAALFWELLGPERIKPVKGQPHLQQTKLGWIVGGEIIEAQTQNHAATCHLVTNDELDKRLEEYFRVEGIREPRQFTKEERHCEDYYEKTSHKDESSGHIIVRLPKKDNVTLGESKSTAYKRLKALERRFQTDPQLKEDYVSFMRDYEKMGHMKKVRNQVNDQDGEAYFIPHQPVLRPDSITTKLRVVFDASAKTSLGTSLNDKLMTGPNLQSDLLEIILRFRTYEIVLTADVAMMFRQIYIDEQDQPLQCILWREDPGKEAETYQLTTVTYGTKPAPYLAIKSLKQLAQDEHERLPLAAQALLRDCYMDDILSGARTVDEAINLQKQLDELLDKGKFRLRKWRASKPEVLAHLNEQNKSDQLLILDGQGPLKTLGLLWDSSSDSLQYQVETSEEHEVTKRNVLSKIAQVFDPLGLVGPVLVKGKIIMQQLWQIQIDWDSPLPPDLHTAWSKHYGALPELNNLKITRNVNTGNSTGLIDVVGFADASEKAYGACVYAVSQREEGSIISNIICSKSKIAPLKTLSLPRLELMAAVLLAELKELIEKAFGEKIRNIDLFSDSTVTLGWIRTEPNNLKTFVANRVCKIQSITDDSTWHHTPSQDNPADMLSRGISVEELEKNDHWWHGPAWITNRQEWPKQPMDLESNQLEMKTSKVVLTITAQRNKIFDRTSNYSKLRRIVAYCLRVRHFVDIKKKNRQENQQQPKKIQPLSVGELEYAEKVLARLVQEEVFEEELAALRNQRQLGKKSPIVELNPFIDPEGIIRVGGRLRHAEISLDRKHPILLPSSHTLTTMLLKNEHERLMHCGSEQLLSAIRLRYWILSGRREVKKVIRGCLKCFRCRPTAPQILMGDLPGGRVNESVRPFTCTGVDYAGPIRVRESHRRGNIPITKGYIAIFVCFNTKAVHIELVSDLTTEAFIAALRRFTARRGICNQIFSDNGSNFIGAAAEIKELHKFLEKEGNDIASTLAEQKITWKFIPPRAPNCGGLWEAAVKVAKKRLNAVTQGLILTFEEYSTLLAEIEAVMNSRPLTPVSSDPSNLTVLTPAHFLINDSLIQPVQPNLEEVPNNRLSRWQLLQKVRQHFWRRWSLEYLQELQKRSKWATGDDNMTMGTMVLIMDDNLPPLRWIMGRVIELFPGRDGVVRTATVKTQTGLLQRSIRKLCPLPIDNQFKST